MAKDLGEAKVTLVLDAKQVRAALGQAEAQLKGFSTRVTAIGTRMQTVGKSIAGVGSKLLMFGTLVGGIGALVGKKLVSDFAKFDQQLIESRNIAGQTIAVWDNVRKMVDKLAKTTRFTPQEIADSVRILASAGKKTKEEMEPILKSATDLADAIGADLPSAIGLMVSGVEAFTVTTSRLTSEASKAAAVADELRNIQGAARVEAEDLQRFMESVAGTLAGMQLSSKEALAMFGTVNQTMGNGAKAAVGLRQAMVMLNKSVVNQQAMKYLQPRLEALKLTLDDIRPSIVGLDTAFRNLSAVEMDSAQATRILGMEGSIVFSLWENSLPLYERNRRAMDETGTAAATAAKNLATFGGQLKILTGSWDAFKIKIGEVLAKTIMPLVSGGIKWLNEVAIPWVEQNERLISSIVGWGAALVGASIALGAFLLVVGKLAALGGGLIVTLVKLKVVMIGLATNPFVLVLSAATALVAVYGEMNSETKALVENSRDLIDATNAEAAAMDSMHEKDIEKHLVLRQMFEVTNRTREQQDLMNRIASELEPKYKGMKFHWNGIGDAVGEAADNQERMLAAIKGQRLDRMTARAQELRDQVDMVSARMSVLYEKLVEDTSVSGSVAFVLNSIFGTLGGTDWQEQYDMLDAERTALQDAWADTVHRIKTAKKAIEDEGKQEPGTGPLSDAELDRLKAAATEEANRKDTLLKQGEAAEKRHTERLRNEVNARKTDMQREIDSRKKVTAEAIKDLEAMIAAERARGMSAENAGKVIDMKEEIKKRTAELETDVLKIRKKFGGKNKDLRDEFIRREKLALIRLKGDKIAIAKAEAAETLKIKKEEIDKKFAMETAAQDMTSEEWVKATQKRKRAVELVEAVAAANVKKVEDEVAEANKKKKNADEEHLRVLKEKVNTYQQLIQFRRAMRQFEQEAFKAANDSLIVERLLQEEKAKGTNPERIAKLQVLADLRRQQAEKRAQEAGLNPTLTDEALKQKGAAATAEAVAKTQLLKTQTTEAKDLVFSVLDDIVIGMGSKAGEAMDAFSVAFKSKWEVFIAWANEAGDQLKTAFSPETKHSPSLIDVMHHSVSVVGDAIAKMKDEVAVATPDLSLAHAMKGVSAGGMGGIVPSRTEGQGTTVTENNTLDMNVSSQIDTEELGRQVRRHFCRSKKRAL